MGITHNIIVMFAAIILLALVPLSLADPGEDQLNRKCCTDYVFCLCELVPTGRSLTEVEELNREDAVEDVRGVRLTRGAAGKCTPLVFLANGCKGRSLPEVEELNREDAVEDVRGVRLTRGAAGKCTPLVFLANGCKGK